MENAQSKEYIRQSEREKQPGVDTFDNAQITDLRNEKIYKKEFLNDTDK